MTRKDYEKFATMYRNNFRTMAEAKSEGMYVATSTISLLMKHTADIFEADNPSFNRQRFYNACTTYST